MKHTSKSNSDKPIKTHQVIAFIDRPKPEVQITTKNTNIVTKDSVNPIIY